MSDLPRDPAPEHAPEPNSVGAPPPASDAVSREPFLSDAPLAEGSSIRATTDSPGQSPAPDRWAHRRAEPRPLAFFWTTLLAIGTVIALAGTTSAGILAQDIYRPAVRTLLAVALTCACLLWPLFRLSQPPEPIRGTRVAIRDLPVVFIPLVAVLLPQRLWFLAGWPTSIIVAIAVAMLGWLFVVGGVLAAALDRVRANDPARSRVVAMLSIILLMGAAPAVLLVTGGVTTPGDHGPLMLGSPLTCITALTVDRPWSGLGPRVEPGHWAAVGALWGAAGISWLRAAWVARGLPPPEASVARGGSPA